MVRYGHLLLPLLLLAPACSEDPLSDAPYLDDPYRVPDLGPSLDADFDDPLLLTIAAARERTEYRADEGYTLVSDEALSLVTDTAGTVGIAFAVGGSLMVGEAEFQSPVTLHHTASDSLLFTFDLTGSLSVEVRAAATTSRVLSMEVWLFNDSETEADVTVIPWLRRCDGGYTAVSERDGGLTAEHHVEISDEEALFAPGTFVEDAADALVMEGTSIERSTLEVCSDSLSDDVGELRSGGTVGTPRSRRSPCAGRSRCRLEAGRSSACAAPSSPRSRNRNSTGSSIWRRPTTSSNSWRMGTPGSRTDPQPPLPSVRLIYCCIRPSPSSTS